PLLDRRAGLLKLYAHRSELIFELLELAVTPVERFLTLGEAFQLLVERVFAFGQPLLVFFQISQCVGDFLIEDLAALSGLFLGFKFDALASGLAFYSGGMDDLLGFFACASERSAGNQPEPHPAEQRAEDKCHEN